MSRSPAAASNTTSTNPTAADDDDAALPAALPATPGLRYVQYQVEQEHLYLKPIRALISRDLSEPYSIYVYRYFLNQWPDLCFMALDSTTPTPVPSATTTETTTGITTAAAAAAAATPTPLIGVIVCKLEPHPSGTNRGYIAMLATQHTHRNRGVGTALARLAIAHMRARGADEVVLETEVSNAASLRLYERLGFLRAKRLHRYYLNGSTAFRLALYLREGAGTKLPGGLGPGEGGEGQVEVVAEGEDDDAPAPAAGLPVLAPQRGAAVSAGVA